MYLAFTPEQDDLRAGLRRFLEDKSPSAEVRRLMETDEGFDRSLWTQMAEQLGLQGLALPEEHGGSGGGILEQLVVLEEMGRSLLPAPYFSTVVLAATALLHSQDEGAQKDLLPGIAAGTTVATLALTESLDGRWIPDAVTTVARAGNDGSYLLDGAKTLVLDGHVADLLLVVARTQAGPTLFAVDGDAPGLQRRLLSTLDPTRKLAALELSGTPGRLIGAEGAAAAIIEPTLQQAAILLSAESLGGAQRSLDTAVEYAKMRVQFNRPIGSFQAVKHKCVDMLLEVESARSAVYYAAWAVADGSDEVPLVSSLAKAYASDAYANTTTETIQVLGGIGFTWEHDAHLYYRRARSSQQLLGSPAQHRDRVAELLLAVPDAEG